MRNGICITLREFVGGKCSFGDVIVELCEKFRDYLLKCKQICLHLLNSAADYYSTFRALQKVAYKEKMMRENLNNFLEKIEWRDFEINPDQGYYIRICTEKTETEATLPISNEALELYGEWGPEKYSKA